MFRDANQSLLLQEEVFQVLSFLNTFGVDFSLRSKSLPQDPSESSASDILSYLQTFRHSGTPEELVRFAHQFFGRNAGFSLTQR